MWEMEGGRVSSRPSGTGGLPSCFPTGCKIRNDQLLGRSCGDLGSEGRTEEWQSTLFPRLTEDVRLGGLQSLAIEGVWVASRALWDDTEPLCR